MRRQIKHSTSTTCQNVSGGHSHNKRQKKKKVVEHEEEAGEDDNNQIGQKKERSNKCSVERRLCGLRGF